MFLRRKKICWHERARELVWPRAGWRRVLNYMFHRMARLPGSPYFIAAGFACGAAISFTPFVGMHFILSCLLAWIIRSSMLAAAIGTVVGNPWTFPFIWIWIYKSGQWMLTLEGGHPVGHIDFLHLFGSLTQAFLRLDMAFVFEKAWPVFLPMLIGSIPSAIVVWFIFYFALKPAVAAYQHQRRSRRIRKAQEKQHASST